MDFNLAYIPADFTKEAEEEFDRQYMKALFDMAYERGKAGYDWEKMPPELETAPIQCR